MSTSEQKTEEKAVVSPTVPPKADAAIPISPKKETKKPKSSKNLTASDLKINPILLENELIYPKLVQPAPRSGLQLFLFELPLLFHIPLFFLYNLTYDQWVLLFWNVLASFVLGMFCVDMLNRAMKSKDKKYIFFGLVLMAFAGIIVLIFQGVSYYIIWPIRQYPVFGRLWARLLRVFS